MTFVISVAVVGDQKALKHSGMGLGNGTAGPLSGVGEFGMATSCSGGGGPSSMEIGPLSDVDPNAAMGDDLVSSLQVRT